MVNIAKPVVLDIKKQTNTIQNPEIECMNLEHGRKLIPGKTIYCLLAVILIIIGKYFFDLNQQAFYNNIRKNTATVFFSKVIDVNVHEPVHKINNDNDLIRINLHLKYVPNNTEDNIAVLPQYTSEANE